MRLEFAITEERLRQVRSLLFDQRPDNDDPERGFLALIFPATGLERRTLILGPIIEPTLGDVSWSSERGLIMSPRYYSRALGVAKSVKGAGLINIHSHPRPRNQATPPRPSDPDLATDREELCFVSRTLGELRPVAAGIISAGGGISVREYHFQIPQTQDEAMRPEFGPAGGSFEFADRVRVVGPGVRLMAANPDLDFENAVIDLSTTESSALLWGEAGQKILSRLNVGLAGQGGVGGMLAEHLARLGVGSLVLVEYDRLEEANFNRSQGAKREEAKSKLPKVELYSRIAKQSATAPNFRISAHRASVAEKQGLLPLLDCDVIVCAADDAFARQVLDHASYAHLIPVIDGGTTLIANPLTMQLQAGKSQVVTAGPGHACLECQKVYTREEATIARESSSWGRYLELDGNSEERHASRAPSVVCNNALVAGLMGLRLLAIVLGVTPETVRGIQRYYVEEGVLRWGAIRDCADTCPKNSWTGRGDTHFVPVGIDLRWKETREKERPRALSWASLKKLFSGTTRSK